MSKMLSQLGVNKALLSPEEREFLDQNGYVSLGQILSEEDVDQINAAIDVILAREGENAGFELVDSKYIRHPRETGVDRVADLVNKGEIFDIFYTQPRVLAAISQVLGPEIKLSSLNYRAAHKGFGNQKLHADWHETVAPGDYKVCNSIWLLDDFVHFEIVDNGAGISNPSRIYELWAEEFEGAYDEQGVFCLTMHPQVIGRHPRIRMLERLIQFMRGHAGVEFMTCSEAVAVWSASH